MSETKKILIFNPKTKNFSSKSHRERNGGNCKLGILDCSADNEGQIAIFCFFISYLGNRLKPAETVKETFFTCKMYSRVGTILYAQYAVPKTFIILSKIQAHLRKELRNKFYFSA